jgi:dolichol-phosphate mannosyltransferase
VAPNHPQVNRATRPVPIVSICSPVHNEEGNLHELMTRVAVAMDGAAVGIWEHILVDDGSTDSSGQIIDEISGIDCRFRALHHHVNQGETAAWRTALRAVEGQVACIIAADLQSPPEELPRLVAAVLDSDFDVGTGRRVQRKDRSFYLISTWILTQFSRFALGLNVRDFSSSFFAVRVKFINNLKLVENDHRYILAILARRGASIREIDTAHCQRFQGSSHYSRWKILGAIPEVARFTLRLLQGYYD